MITAEHIISAYVKTSQLILIDSQYTIRRIAFDGSNNWKVEIVDGTSRNIIGVYFNNYKIWVELCNKFKCKYEDKECYPLKIKDGLVEISQDKIIKVVDWDKVWIYGLEPRSRMG